MSNDQIQLKPPISQWLNAWDSEAESVKIEQPDAEPKRRTLLECCAQLLKTAKMRGMTDESAMATFADFVSDPFERE
jgi:hypothetical protein